MATRKKRAPEHKQVVAVKRARARRIHLWSDQKQLVAAITKKLRMERDELGSDFADEVENAYPSGSSSLLEDHLEEVAFEFKDDMLNMKDQVDAFISNFEGKPTATGLAAYNGFVRRLVSYLVRSNTRAVEWAYKESHYQELLEDDERDIRDARYAEKAGY